MLTIKKILIPIDFSARCRDAVPYAVWIARKLGSEVVLFNVIDAHDSFGYGAASNTFVYGSSSHGLREKRETMLAAFEAAHLVGLPVIRIVEFGEPSECIASYAEQNGIDLILMPTHGRGKFRNLLLGSVTSKVLHDVQCPVWTTAHSDLSMDGANQEIRNIVCAVELSSEAPRILAAACDLAQQFGAVLRLVHAIPSLKLEVDGLVEDAPLGGFLLDTSQKQLMALQAEAGTAFDVYIEQGGVAEVAREAVVATDAQLLIIGRGHITKLLGGLRTNVGSLIRESPCPVLSV